MFNVTVLKMKDIIKCLVGIIIAVAFITITTRYFSSSKQDENKNNGTIITQISKTLENFINNKLTEGLEETMPVLSVTNQPVKEANAEIKQDDNEILKKMLASEIDSIEIIKNQEENNVENNETAENQATEEKTETENTVETAQTNVKTEVVTNNPLTESYNVQYGAVKIKNQTSYTLTEEMLNPDITLDNKNILLFHTHSCESYTASEKYQYTPTGNFRTTDLNFTVTRVGAELETQLKQYGY